MSSLRRGLTRPETYLAGVALLCALVAFDGSAASHRQVGVRLYVRGVRLYQTFGRPLTTRWMRCPYRPTCSEFSREAVERFGLWAGLAMTGRRLWACRSSVRPGNRGPSGGIRP